MTTKFLNELLDEATALTKSMKELQRQAKAEKRALTDGERDQIDELSDRFEAVNDQIDRLRHEGDAAPDSAGPTSPNASRANTNILTGEPMGEAGLYPTAGKQQRTHRFGEAVRAWLKNPTRENRDFMTAGAGAVLQNPRIMQEVFFSLEANNPLVTLGAQILNVTNYSQWAVPTTPPSTQWFAEGDTVNADSAMVIGSKKIEFNNCVALVKISKFLLQDNAVDSSKVIHEEIMRAIRRETLRVVFHGAAASKEPAGLDEIVGVQDVDGSTFTGYGPIIEAFASVMAEDAPLENIGMVGGVNLWERMTKWEDQQDNPLIVPPAFSRSKGFHFTSVISESFGTTPYLTRAYVADFSQLKIGYAGPFSLELVERYSDTMHTAVLVWFRVDVQALRPACFCRIEDIPIV